MDIYLHKSLVKANKQSKKLNRESSEAGSKSGGRLPSSADRGVGGQRGGKYVARVQVGYTKDNKPQYKYFTSVEDYRTYLENKGKTKGEKKEPDSGTSDSLKRKKTKEEKKERKLRSEGIGAFIKDKDKKKKVEKSLSLFIEV